jgi:molecular chaperone GrpE
VSNEKGSFSADISQRAIEEALRSVEAHERRPADGEAPPPSEEGGADVIPIEVAAAPKQEEEPPSQVTELQTQLDLSLAKGREMMEKVKESHERMLRAAADLDNFKKRAQRERDEAQRFGIERLLKDFLPVLDNLDRALEHAQTSPDLDALVKGVQMTRKQFEDTLGKHGVKGFSALGQPFDPRIHEAMQQKEAADVPPNQVVFEVAKGYFLHERLIRPALVVVSTGTAQPAAPAEESAPVPGVPDVPGEEGAA